MRFRGKSIRRKVTALVLVPLLSLLTVWALAVAVTVPDARGAGAAGDAAQKLTGPVLDLVDAVQQERRQTLVQLGDPRRADGLSALRDIRERATGAAERVDSLGRSAAGDLPGAARDRLAGLTDAVDGLATLREQVDSNTISRPDALAAYTGLVTPALRLLDTLRPTDDPGLAAQGHALVGLARARDLLSQEDALVSGALAFGRTTDGELRALADLLAQRDLAERTAVPDLPIQDREAYEAFSGGGTARILADAEQNLLAGRTGTVRPDHWQEAATTALDALAELGDDARARYEAGVAPESSGQRSRALLLLVTGALALALSVWVAARVGRDLVRDLRSLSREARDAAETRLPGVVRRLAAGEHVDVETEAPVLDYGDDELGRIGRAVNTLRREAVGATVDRARTRRGMAEVFVNLARRSQVLLHRQLTLLETVERRAGTSDDAGDLVRAVHLASRMRRHAEGLVILSGAAPARQWRRPETLMDVVRAAVAEVEDFERVEVRLLPPLTVAGGAVADLVHLVAELLENATVFSPPHTAVQVTGERVPHGFTLEIHDRGLGMTADALREANARLADAPEFEPSDTDRVGLFVVSRLAERHGIRVSLRDSPYGGTTAVTLVPGELLTEARDEPPRRLSHVPGRPALRGGPVDGPVELDAPVGPAGTEPGGGDGDVRDGAPGEGEPGGAPPGRPGLPRRHRAPVLVADHGRPVAPPPDDDPPGHPAATPVGLPRRVRGPAARGGPDTKDGPDGPDGPDAEGAGVRGVPSGDDPPELDAEAVRARVAALQRGWRRGRQQTGGPPSDGTPASPEP
ncbi:nitrate- and nitrite sensing domain-containing protein [Streptomyces sp. RFCAC02]|uniref:nitrate- and nitrite sensing domain-containing protein n=1 Tax=Streptomyces sp. RFCAC02 TaxID=2499143 RepID=UPI00101ED31C|nr:nitrate- and nitrite sensing domain-containing protein [Streptomyces sp. RFCAC02]